MTAHQTTTPLLDRMAARRPVPAHDPAYCDRYRPFAHVCNQPHAAADPSGVRQPRPRWMARLQAKDTTGTVAL